MPLTRPGTNATSRVHQKAVEVEMLWFLVSRGEHVTDQGQHARKKVE